MTLILSHSKPDGLDVKTHGAYGDLANKVFIRRLRD